MVSAVSAGSAFACAALAGLADEVIDDFAGRAARNRKNVYPENLLKGEPAFPHAAMYRQAILDCIDAETLARLHAGPEIRVLLAYPPSRRAVIPSLLAGLLAYKLDRKLKGRVHAQWPLRLGFEAVMVRVSDCQDPEELADLILQSSCTPPVTPLLRRGGRPVVDGGIIDSVPVQLVADAKTQLVLLTRRYPRHMLPKIEGRRYVQPSQDLEISVWDYANPGGLRAAFELGSRDGRAFLASA